MPLLPILAQLISAGGLPVITRAVGKILSGKDGALKQAGDLILSTSSEEINSRLNGRQSADLALAQLKNDKAEIEGNFELLIEQQKTQRSELASTSILARNWRPLFGILVAVSWFSQMFGITILIFLEPESAPIVITALASLTVQWSMGFAAIGVNIHSRSKDKRIQAASDMNQSLPASLLEALLSKKDK